MSKEKENKDAGEAAAADGEGKKSKKKLLIIAVAGVVLLGALVGGAFMFFSGGSKPTESGHGEEVSGEAGAEGEASDEHGEKAADENGEKPAEGHKEKAAEGHGEKAADEKGEKAGDGHEAKDGKDKKDSGKKEEGASSGAYGFGKAFSLKPFNLNLGNPVENHYIRLELTLEFKGGDNQEGELNVRTPQLRDAVISVTSRKTREFLLSPDGKDRLRYELLNQINSLLTQPIENVFITDMIIE